MRHLATTLPADYAKLLIGENPLESERTLAKDASLDHVFWPFVGHDHGNGCHRHGALGPEGQALWRADSSAVGRKAT